MSILLASTSPRRRDLLTEWGVAFEIVAPDADETRRAGELPRAYAERTACDKVRSVATQHPTRVVLGADTIVVLANEVFVKPVDAADAVTMLQRLCGRTHDVISAVALYDPTTQQIACRTAIAHVTMARVEPAELRQYVATGEPLDKAGAYAVQGLGGRLVTRIDGDYFAVVGLPKAVTLEMLASVQANGCHPER